MTDLAGLRDAVIVSLMADDLGLYEVMWELDDGDIQDVELDLRKVATWEAARDVVLALLSEGMIGVETKVDDKVLDLPKPPADVVSDKAVWHPSEWGKVEYRLTLLNDDPYGLLRARERREDDPSSAS